MLDESGREVPAGTPGRLCFRDSTGRGLVYAIEGLDSDSGLGAGVFTLGEIGYVDDEGYAYITDRNADLVVSGGVNVYPAEAERVLASHPGVEDVAAFGVPHPEMGEELRALVVVSDPRVQPAQLLAHCRSQLAGFKCPRSVQIVDQLPRTAMGKLDKRVLRERYGAGVTVVGVRSTGPGPSSAALAYPWPTSKNGLKARGGWNRGSSPGGSARRSATT